MCISLIYIDRYTASNNSQLFHSSGGLLHIDWLHTITVTLACMHSGTQSAYRHATISHAHTHTTVFPGPPRWAGARREFLDFMVQGKINRGRHTDHPAGRHSIRTNQCRPPPSPIFYRPDALPAAQPMVSKHWRQLEQTCNYFINNISALLCLVSCRLKGLKLMKLMLLKLNASLPNNSVSRLKIITLLRAKYQTAHAIHQHSERFSTYFYPCLYT